MVKPRYGLSIDYRLTVRNSACLFNMGDLHFILLGGSFMLKRCWVG